MLLLLGSYPIKITETITRRTTSIKALKSEGRTNERRVSELISRTIICKYKQNHT